jgi:hypothetical protein
MPTYSAPAARCSAEAIHVVQGDIELFALHVTDIIGLKNTGTVPCTLEGYPKVTSYDQAGRKIDVTFRYSPRGSTYTVGRPRLITLVPDQVAGLYIGQLDGTITNSPPRCVQAYNAPLQIVLPGTTEPLHPGPRTDFTCPGGTTYVSPIEPSDAPYSG